MLHHHNPHFVGRVQAWLREYFRDYHAEDVHLPRMRALPDSTIVPVADLFTEEECRTSRVYNEAMVRTHGQRGLTTRLDGPGGSRIVWGIADPVDGHSWSSSQIETVSRVLPHLRQYVRVRSALVDAGALGTSVAELLGKLLGHTQVQTTARYAHLAWDSIQNAAARITESIGGN